MMVCSSIQRDKTEQGPSSSRPPEILAMTSKSFQTKAHIATEILNTYDTSCAKSFSGPKMNILLY